MRWLISILLISVLCSSCRKDRNSDGVDIKWRVKLDDDIPLNLFNFDPLIYKDLVIQRVKNRGKIIAFNKTTGEEVWRWTDGFDNYGVDGFEVGGYIYNNMLITGKTNLTVAINLDTGETVWENLANTNSVPFIRGVGDKIVKYDYNPEVVYFIRLGNANTGEFETIHHWEREDGFFIANTLPLIFEWEGVEYVVWSQVKWGGATGIENNQFLHLYNLNEKRIEWISDTINLDSNASGYAGLRPKFYDGQIYLENDAIYSYNVEDGSLEWRNHYHGRFDNSRLTIADGKVFANNDNNKYLIALDAHTGLEYWRTESANIMSRIVHHDDKIYIAGGLTSDVDRRLHIFDANTGEKILDHTLQVNGDFIGEYAKVITVDPSTGLVYTGDHENLICIDFGL